MNKTFLSVSADDVTASRRLTKRLFGLAAFLSFLVSVSLWFTGLREEGVFVGLWVPSILATGCLLIVGEH